jgi:hypothetical protein
MIVNNVGEALWRDGKYYPVRYVVPIDGYKNKLLFVLFMDNDRAILHKSEVRCPNIKQFDYYSDSRFFASTKAKDLLKGGIVEPTVIETAENSHPKSEEYLGEPSNEKVRPELIISKLSEVLIEILNSDLIDPTGKRTNRPLFDRNEPEISKQLAQIFSDRGYSNIQSVFAEKRYPLSNERCDIVLKYNSTNSFWIELKQSWEKKCTDWVTDFKEEEFLKDILKLKNIPHGDSGVIMHLAYRPTSDFPQDYPIPFLISAMKDNPYEWRFFSMPTKDHGQCYCHLITWLM